MGKGIEFFLQASSNLLAENRLLKFAVIMITVAIIFLSIQVKAALEYQRVIIVPPVVSSVMSVRGDKADENYLIAMARYIAGLTFHYTPGTARKQFEELLHLFAPEKFNDAKEWLADLAGTIEGARVTSSFYVERFKVGESTIQIEGTQRSFTDEILLSSRRPVYVVSYKLKNGRFEILSIEEKSEEKKKNDKR